MYAIKMTSDGITHTSKFHNNRFRNSSMPLRWPQVAWYTYQVSWYDIHTKYHDDWFKHSSNINAITSTIWEATVLVLLMRGIYDVHVQMGSCGMIYLPSFMKIGTGIQAISRFCLSNLSGCNVDITDGRFLWSEPLRCALEAWYTYKVSWRLVQAFKQY
jgi:hypothetical protein